MRMVMDIWDYVNTVFRRLRGDAEGRAVTLPEGQYLLAPGVLADEDYHHLTLTVDKKLRVDDPTTQAAVAAVEAKVDDVEAKLDVPANYMANLTTLETRLSAVRAGYLDQLDFALREAIAALQTDLDNPAQYKADLTTLEARLSAVRAGYLDQLDFNLQEAIAAVKAEVEGIGGVAMRGTDDAALASVLEDAMQKATGPLYTQDTDSQEAIREAIDARPAERGTDLAQLEADAATRYAALDALIDALEAKLDTPGNFQADVSALALEATLTAIKGAGWTIETLKAIYDFIAINHSIIGDIDTEVGAIETKLDTPANFMADLSTLEARLSAVRAGYLDQLDFALQEAIAAIPTVMRGTDDALLAASYVTERGTDNALLAASYTAERGTDSAALASVLEDAMQKLTTPAYNQDTDSQEAIREAIDARPAERGTDNALLAANYTPERGTDEAALAATLEDAMQKATGPAWNQDTDSLEALREAIDAITAERGTDNALLAASYTAERGTDNAETEADASTRYTALAAYVDEVESLLKNATYGVAALETLVDDLETRLTAVRAGYLDQLDFALQEKLLEIDAEVEGLGGAAMRGTDSAALAAHYTSTRAGYLNQLDFNLREKLIEIDAEVEGLGGAAMRGTDNALLAASYVTERGTDNAALAASWTAALATILGNFSAARIGYLDNIDANLKELFYEHFASTVDDISGLILSGTAPNYANLFDNSLLTYITFSAINQYVELTFGAPVYIKQFRYHGRVTHNQNGAYKIQAYVDGSWVDVKTGIPTRPSTWSSWISLTTPSLAVLWRVVATTIDSSTSNTPLQWEFKGVRVG